MNALLRRAQGRHQIIFFKSYSRWILDLELDNRQFLDRWVQRHQGILYLSM